MLTFPGRARSIGRRRRDRRAGTADGNGSRERYGHFRVDTRTPRNPCGRVSELVPSFPGTGTRVGISGNTSCRPASRAVAIHPMVLRRTDSATGPPKGAAARRPWWRQRGMPSSVVIASPVKCKLYNLQNVTSKQR